VALASTIPPGTIPADAASDVLAALKDLPFTAHTLALAGLVVGLLLWAFGRGLSRLAVATLGALLGATAGFFLLPLTGVETLAGLASPHIGVIVGAALGLILGAVLLRVVVLVSSTLVLATAGATVAAAVLQVLALAPSASTPLEGAELLLQGPAITTTESSESGDGEPDDEGEEAGRDVEAGESPSDLQTAATKARRFMDAAWSELRVVWLNQPGAARLWISGVSLAGALVGAALGFFAPKRAARAVTSLIGAAVWLACTAWFLTLTEVLPNAPLLQGPIPWILAWVVVSGLGILVQRRTDRRAGARAE